MDNTDSARWLVKTGGKVLGPYSMEKISELLLSKEIMVLDEVSEPFRRWQYIRDHSKFADVVEELRRSEFQNSEDHTFTTSTADQTASVTEKLNDQMLDDLTDEAPAPSSMSEIVIEDIDEIQTPGAIKKSSSARFQQSSQRQSYIEERSEKASGFLWISTLTILLLVGGYVYFHKHFLKESSSLKSAKEYLEMAERHYRVGDYIKALEPLKKAQKLEPRDPWTNILLAPLLIQYEPEKKLEANRMLEAVLDSNEGNKKTAWTTMGLLQLKQEDFESAKESLNKALQLDPQHWQALINLGVIGLLEQDYSVAKNHFQSAMNVSSRQLANQGEAYLMLAEADIFLWQEENDPEYLTQAFQVLEDYLVENQDFRQEALMLKAYVAHSKGDDVQAKRIIDQVMDTDPLMTDEHSKDPTVARMPLEWTYLLNWCQQLVKGMSSNSHMEALHALCLVQSKNKEIEAKEAINAAVEQSPRDPLIQALFAYISWQLGMDAQADTISAKALELNAGLDFKLPHIVKARLCEDVGNFDCVREQWNRVLALDPESISAIGGLASLEIESRNLKAFERSYYKGRKLSKFYKPLLRSQWKAEQEGLGIDKK